MPRTRARRSHKLRQNRQPKQTQPCLAQGLFHTPHAAHPSNDKTLKALPPSPARQQHRTRANAFDASNASKEVAAQRANTETLGRVRRKGAMPDRKSLRRSRQKDALQQVSRTRPGPCLSRRVLTSTRSHKRSHSRKRTRNNQHQRTRHLKETSRQNENRTHCLVGNKRADSCE